MVRVAIFITSAMVAMSLAAAIPEEPAQGSEKVTGLDSDDGQGFSQLEKRQQFFQCLSAQTTATDANRCISQLESRGGLCTGNNTWCTIGTARVRGATNAEDVGQRVTCRNAAATVRNIVNRCRGGTAFASGQSSAVSNRRIIVTLSSP